MSSVPSRSPTPESLPTTEHIETARPSSPPPESANAPRRDPGIRIQLNGEDLFVPECGTEGGITPPYYQPSWAVLDVYPCSFDDYHDAYHAEVSHVGGTEVWLGSTDWDDGRDPYDDVDESQETPEAWADMASYSYDGHFDPHTPNADQSHEGEANAAMTAATDTAVPNPKVEEEATATNSNGLHDALEELTVQDKQGDDNTAEETSVHNKAGGDDTPEETTVELQSGRSPEDPSKKKPRKRKNKNKNTNRGPTALNKYRGSGFEDNFADPPMTLDEYHEEKLIYDPNRSFDDRIEECIQRFRGRRRLDPTRTLIFSRYLSLGGVDTTQRQFQGMCGMSKDQLGDMSAAEIREAKANDVIGRGYASDIRFYTAGEEGWEVDFTGVVSSYLSRLLPFDTAGDLVLIQTGVDTILNFLTYVQRHEACPEYAADIERARNVCKVAKVEWPLIQSAKDSGIGQFNFACGQLFGRGRRSNKDKNKDDNDGQDVVWIEPADMVDLTKQKSLDVGIVFVSTLTILGPYLKAYDPHHSTRGGTIPIPRLDKDPELQVLTTGVTSVERKTEQVRIVKIHSPTDKDNKLFRGIMDSSRTLAKYLPAGLLVVTQDIIEDGWANTPKLHHQTQSSSPDQQQQQQQQQHQRDAYIMDEKFLRKLRPGMMLELETATVQHPDFELKFVVAVPAIEPSFYTFLPQELMLNFKDPRVEPRPPPMADEADDEVDPGPGLEGNTDDLDDM